MPEGERVASWRSLPATVTACLLAVTAIVAFIFYQQALRAADAQRSAHAALMRTAIHGAISATESRVEDLAVSIGQQWPVRRSDFSALAQALLQSPGVSRVSLLRFLRHSERSKFEARNGAVVELSQGAGQGPPPSAPLRHGTGAPSQSAFAQGRPAVGARPAPPGPTAEGRPLALFLQRAPPSAFGFVITLSEQASGSLPKNLDLRDLAPRRIALLAAGASGRISATPPVAALLAAPASPGPATALEVPIYRRGAPRSTQTQRLAALRGFVEADFHDAMLASAVAGKAPEGAGYVLSDGPFTLLRSGTPQHATHLSVSVAGRSWTLLVGRPEADLTRALDTLIAGGVLALLIGLLSLQAARRERHALDLAQRRSAERNLAESALETAERRFKTAFSEAPIGMALISPEGSFLQVNRSMTRISRYAERELLALDVSALTHPEDRAADEVAMALMRKDELRVHDVEKRLLDAQGEVVWVSVHTTLVKDDQGQPSYFLSQLEDITARRRYESRLQHMADHDPLTGLLNRRAYERALKEHLASRRGGDADGAVLVIDLDDFKQVNDTLGHRAGDDLIVRVSGALAARLRSDDVVARLGGDEFAVLLRGGGVQEAQRVASSLLATIKCQRAARAPGGRERPIGASIGIAQIGGASPITAEQILSAADLAMYDAKEAGRDRVESYGEQTPKVVEGPQQRVESRLRWVERIRSALDEDTFVLLAQPVVHAASGQITQYELLMRMLERDGSLTSPGAFLPVAERYDLIREVDRWAIARAIGMLRAELARGRRPTVEINLSGQSISDERLPDLVATKLAATGVSAAQLIFEVTETAAIANISAARACAERLGSIGCRFALDDFGAGFGSFYYLKHLPFDFIKIDGEFVRDCTGNEVDRLLVRAVVDLAKGMGKQTIAEFVEDEQTLLALPELGVDFAQGFHLGRPAPLQAWLSHAAGETTRPDVGLQGEGGAGEGLVKEAQEGAPSAREGAHAAQDDACEEAAQRRCEDSQSSGYDAEEGARAALSESA